MTDEERPVGYKNPPGRTRFQKGGPQPARKRKCTEGIDAHAFFSTPVKVSHGETIKKIHPFELSFRQLVQAAIKGDMRKARLVLKEFEKAGLFADNADASAWPSRIYLPVDYDKAEWQANLIKYGPPPWPFEPDGLCRLQELRDAHARR